MRGVEVLELVDEQVSAATLGRAPGFGVAEEDLDRPVDLLVEVDAPASARASGRRRTRGQALGIGDVLFDAVGDVRPSRTAERASM